MNRTKLISLDSLRQEKWHHNYCIAVMNTTKLVLLDSLLTEKWHHHYCIAVMNTTKLILLDSLLQEKWHHDYWKKYMKMWKQIIKSCSSHSRSCKRKTGTWYSNVCRWQWSTKLWSDTTASVSSNWVVCLPVLKNFQNSVKAVKVRLKWLTLAYQQNHLGLRCSFLSSGPELQ